MKLKIIQAAVMVTIMLIAVSFTYPKNDALLPSGYSVGSNATDFKLKNTDGKMVSLADFKDAKGFIVIFTDILCKSTTQYEDRIMALDSKFRRKGFPVISINPADPKINEGDGYENMQMRAKRMFYSFPCLFDENRETTKAFGVTKTPTTYVLLKEGDKYVVKYIGSIDDYADDAASVNYPYVQDAVNELLKGQQVTKKSTEGDGCEVK